MHLCRYFPFPCSTPNPLQSLTPVISLLFSPLLGLLTFLTSPPLMGITLAVIHQRRSGDKGPSTCMKLGATTVPISYGAVQLLPVREQEVSGSERFMIGHQMCWLYCRWAICLPKCNKYHSLQYPAVRGVWQRARGGGCKTAKCFWQQVAVWRYEGQQNPPPA